MNRIAIVVAALTAVVAAAQAQEVRSHDLGGGSTDNVPPGITRDVTATLLPETRKIRLSWVGSGDDEYSGDAFFCFAFLSPDPDIFFDVQSVYVDPPPAPGETMTIDIGTEDTGMPIDARVRFYILILTYDEAGNESPWHTPLELTTPDAFDVTPPDAIETLVVDAVTTASISLSWAPAWDGGGSGVDEYVVLWRAEADGPVTEANYLEDETYFAEVDATQVAPAPGEEDPGVPVDLETFVLADLEPGTGYYYVVVAIDNAGNEGGEPEANGFARTDALPGPASGGGDSGGGSGGCGSSSTGSGAAGLLALVAFLRRR